MRNCLNHITATGDFAQQDSRCYVLASGVAHVPSSLKASMPAFVPGGMRFCCLKDEGSDSSAELISSAILLSRAFFASSALWRAIFSRCKLGRVPLD